MSEKRPLLSINEKLLELTEKHEKAQAYDQERREKWTPETESLQWANLQELRQGVYEIEAIMLYFDAEYIAEKHAFCLVPRRTIKNVTPP